MGKKKDGGKEKEGLVSRIVRGLKGKKKEAAAAQASISEEEKELEAELRTLLEQKGPEQKGQGQGTGEQGRTLGLKSGEPNPPTIPEQDKNLASQETQAMLPAQSSTNDDPQEQVTASKMPEEVTITNMSHEDLVSRYIDLDDLTIEQNSILNQDSTELQPATVRLSPMSGTVIDGDRIRFKYQNSDAPQIFDISYLETTYKKETLAKKLTTSQVIGKAQDAGYMEVADVGQGQDPDYLDVAPRLGPDDIPSGYMELAPNEAGYMDVAPNPDNVRTGQGQEAGYVDIAPYPDTAPAQDPHYLDVAPNEAGYVDVAPNPDNGGTGQDRIYKEIEPKTASLKAGKEETVEQKNSLLLAAKKGDEGLVRSLLESGEDPNKKDSKGNTPLHYAAEQGNLTIVNIFLAHKKTNVSIKGRSGKTAFQLASKAAKKAENNAAKFGKKLENAENTGQEAALALRETDGLTPKATEAEAKLRSANQGKETFYFLTKAAEKEFRLFNAIADKLKKRYKQDKIAKLAQSTKIGAEQQLVNYLAQSDNRQFITDKALEAASNNDKMLATLEAFGQDMQQTHQQHIKQKAEEWKKILQQQEQQQQQRQEQQQQQQQEQLQQQQLQQQQQAQQLQQQQQQQQQQPQQPQPQQPQQQTLKQAEAAKKADAQLKSAKRASDPRKRYKQDKIAKLAQSTKIGAEQQLVNYLAQSDNRQFITDKALEAASNNDKMLATLKAFGQDMQQTHQQHIKQGAEKWEKSQQQPQQQPAQQQPQQQQPQQPESQGQGPQDQQQPQQRQQPQQQRQQQQQQQTQQQQQQQQQEQQEQQPQPQQQPESQGQGHQAQQQTQINLNKPLKQAQDARIYDDTRKLQEEFCVIGKVPIRQRDNQDEQELEKLSESLIQHLKEEQAIKNVSCSPVQENNKKNVFKLDMHVNNDNSVYFPSHKNETLWFPCYKDDGSLKEGVFAMAITDKDGKVIDGTLMPGNSMPSKLENCIEELHIAEQSCILERFNQEKKDKLKAEVDKLKEAKAELDEKLAALERGQKREAGQSQDASRAYSQNNPFFDTGQESGQDNRKATSAKTIRDTLQNKLNPPSGTPQPRSRGNQGRTRHTRGLHGGRTSSV